MEIRDIKPNTGKIDVVLKVVEKEETRTFKKFGKEGKVCNATVRDDSGKITLTLWNEDIEKVNVGDVIHLQNGWCSEFKGEKQLSTGKFGKIEIVEKGAAKTIVTNDPEMFQDAEREEGEDMEGMEEGNEESFEEEE